MIWIIIILTPTIFSFKFLCRLTFETALKHRGGPSIVFAHSLGNNVFRYFLEWLKLEIAPKKYIQWLDDHIHAYFAVGMSHLHVILATNFKGQFRHLRILILTFRVSTSWVSSNSRSNTFWIHIWTSCTWGLFFKYLFLFPFLCFWVIVLMSIYYQGTARLMFNSFGSSLWMTPFSEYCRSENVYSKHFSTGRKKKHNIYHCDDLEYRLNYSGFPTNIINIEIPSVVGML